tara:strand:+ start:647 stop:1666 length:1020 start_codon:yes stop_codon:yes gene_type:complete
MEVSDITSGSLSGSGVFDSLMRSVKVHLNQEYEKNRFSGEDYSNLYLGAMTAVLQQSIQYALTKEQSDGQAALLVAQASKTEVEEQLVTQQLQNLATEQVNLVKQGAQLDKQNEVLDNQILKTIEDTALVTQQKLNLVAEKTNTNLSGLKISAETQYLSVQQTKTGSDKTLVDQQIANLTLDAVNTPFQGNLVNKQIDKLSEDILASNAQRVQLAKQGLLVDAQTAKATQETAAVLAGVSKINKEVEVLDQRKATEKAQTVDTVDGVAVTGVLGKQKNLYQAQTDGFARDAEQKLTKTFLDIWSVQRTTDEGFTVTGTGVTNAEIGEVVAKAKLGIGVV